MYGKFSIGYRLIPEKAMVIPQYQSTSMESEYTQAYENTLPGITSIPTPIAKSTAVTQASHVPVTRPVQKGISYNLFPVRKQGLDIWKDR